MVKKMKKMLILIILTELLLGNILYAKDTREKNKRYTLSVATLFKDEHKSLKEWIEYHLLVGVDHFYLYNNGSTDSYRETLNEYLSRGIVTLIDWPDMIDCSSCDEETSKFVWTLSTQIPAYENAIKFRAVRETKWLVFLGVDEFLVANTVNGLKKILNQYDECPAIILDSNFFDASQVDVIPPRRLVIEAVELVNAPEENLEKQWEKTIFKPELCDTFMWPPFKYNFKNNLRAVGVSKNKVRINRYTHRFDEYYQIVGRLRDKLHVDNRMLTDDEMKHLLEEGYEIEDQERIIFRFLPELLKRLGYRKDWG